MNIDHIIITRFNVKTTGWSNIDKNNKATRTDEWLFKRFNLFEKYYLPSMANQKNSKFKCLVFFDTDTPEEYKKKILSYKDRYSFFNYEYVNDDVHLGEEVASMVMNLISDDTEYLLTTNVDNDDALHEKAIEIIHKNFKPEDNTAINLTKGYRFLIEDNSLLLKNYFINGPFITFIEKYKSDVKPKTVLHYVHDYFFEMYKTKQVRSGYYWIQTIHDDNVANDLTGRPSLNKDDLKKFAIDIKDINLSHKKFIKYMFYYLINIKEFIPFGWRMYILKLLGKRRLPIPNA